MTQFSILPIDKTKKTSSTKIIPSPETPQSQITFTTTVERTVEPRVRTSTILLTRDAQIPSSTSTEEGPIFSLSSESIKQTFQWLPTANRVIIGVCLGSLFFCFLGIITYKIRKRLQDKRGEERNRTTFSPTNPRTPVTPSSDGLRERRKSKNDIKQNAWF